MGVYAGKYCWHEEWAVKKVTASIQRDIDIMELRPTDNSDTLHTSTAPSNEPSHTPSVYNSDSDDEDILTGTLNVRVWDDSEATYDFLLAIMTNCYTYLCIVTLRKQKKAIVLKMHH